MLLKDYAKDSVKLLFNNFLSSIYTFYSPLTDYFATYSSYSFFKNIFLRLFKVLTVPRIYKSSKKNEANANIIVNTLIHA